MNALTVSVIITTYNRARHLERLLPAFHHLRYDAFEVIVVNGPSTDDSAAVLERWKGKIKVVDCPVAHMTTARNLGLAVAAGDVVVFIDDDALPAAPTWLNAIVEVFAGDTEGRVGAVGGPAWHCDTDLLQFSGGMSSDYGLQIFLADDATAAARADGVRWVRRTIGCNSAFRRSALLAVGGFDEHITYYGDDADVCLRLARAGYQTVHAWEAAVRHYPAASPHLGAPFIRNRRVITQDDTYYSLKNGYDPRLRRLLRTLWLAPRKHYVTEMVGLARGGRISWSALGRFYVAEWPRGMARGIRLGLFHRRANRLTTTSPPPLLAFPKARPARRLRVCVVTDYVPPYDRIGGVERYTYDLARGLHELGHEVHVIARHDARIRRDSLGFTIHGIGLGDLDDRVGFASQLLVTESARFAVAVARRVAELQRQGIAFDVVHTSNWNAPAVALLQARRVPLVLMLVTPLSEVIRIEGREVDDDLRNAVELDRWQIEHADAVCCPSWGILDTYEDTMDLSLRDRPSLHQTPLGIAPMPAQPVASGREARRVLFVGRLDPRNGIDVLLDTLPRLLATHPDWHCDLVGDDRVFVPGTEVTYRARFAATHAGAPWIDRVHFHGVVPDATLARFYAACDVFVAPSLFESFGLVFLEAMQYAKPVVGCRRGGVPDIVRDGVDGLLVEPGDADALAAALDRLMSDAALRESLGRAGLARMRADFDHRAMAARMVPVYERVLADRNMGSGAHHDRADEVRSRPDAAPVNRILDAISAHVTNSRHVGTAAASSVSRTQRIRELVEGFRREPFGGRLLRLKRVVYWFTASAFDRQTKIHEALLPAIAEVEQELAQLRLDLADAEAARHFFDDRDGFRRAPHGDDDRPPT